MRELPPLFREDEAQARSLILTGALAVLGATLLAALAAVVFAPEIAGRIASCISWTMIVIRPNATTHPASDYGRSRRTSSRALRVKAMSSSSSSYKSAYMCAITVIDAWRIVFCSRCKSAPARRASEA